MITCGLDEAGRGALAGPLVAAAVILGKIRLRAKDGKLLKPRERSRIYRRAKRMGVQIFVEVVSTRQINNHGIGWANKMIFRRLIKRTQADQYIIDGNLKIGRVLGKNIQSIVDADATIPQVILVGIIAKVERDRLMRELHKVHPEFGWRRNAGYGTRGHISRLHVLGMTIFHRPIFVTTALRNHPI